MNRHNRRRNDAILRRMPMGTLEKLAQEQSKKRIEIIDNNIQAILKERIPLRFKLLNRIKSGKLVKLFGLHIEVQGDFHTVKLHGKVIGSFTA